MGGGDMSWGAGCLDEAIAATARAGADDNDNDAAPDFADKVGRCRLTVSTRVLKTPMVSALEATV